MSETIVFLFRNLEPVRIVELGCKGFVHSRLANAENQNEYKVKYWLDGTRKEDWFYEFELLPA